MFFFKKVDNFQNYIYIFKQLLSVFETSCLSNYTCIIPNCHIFPPWISFSSPSCNCLSLAVPVVFLPIIIFCKIEKKRKKMTLEKEATENEAKNLNFTLLSNFQGNMLKQKNFKKKLINTANFSNQNQLVLVKSFTNYISKDTVPETANTMFSLS